MGQIIIDRALDIARGGDGRIKKDTGAQAAPDDAKEAT